MKLTVLVENTAPEELSKEWGLSILVEYEGKKRRKTAITESIFFRFILAYVREC